MSELSQIQTGAVVVAVVVSEVLGVVVAVDASNAGGFWYNRMISSDANPFPLLSHRQSDPLPIRSAGIHQSCF